MVSIIRRGLVSTVLALAIVLGAGQPAFADGTQAGTVVLNTVNVDYEVLGVTQATEQGTADFTVDRKIELTVVSANLVTYIQVSPGQLQAIMEFDVTNDSNDVLDFRLAAVNELAAVVEPVLGGTDERDAITLTAFHDVNANGTYEPATDRLYVDELAIDATQRVLVAADIPAFGPAVNGDNIMLSLIATAREGGTLLTEGIALVNDPGPDVEDAEQTVFIDAAGDAVADVANDGSHSDMWAFVILGANLTITKSSALVAPSVFHIPGAIVEYTIVIANGAGSSNATNLVVTDAIPANTTYVAGSITLNTVGQTDALDSPGTDESDFNVTTAGAVTVLNQTVAAGASITITFRVTVD